MVVDNFNLERVPAAELETDSPRAVYGHRPLTSTITAQLVKADALQGAQVLQRGCSIQNRQELDGRFGVEAAELRRFAAFGKTASRGTPLRPDHRASVVRVA